MAIVGLSSSGPHFRFRWSRKPHFRWFRRPHFRWSRKPHFAAPQLGKIMGKIMGSAPGGHSIQRPQFFKIGKSKVCYWPVNCTCYCLVLTPQYRPKPPRSVNPTPRRKVMDHANQMAKCGFRDQRVSSGCCSLLLLDGLRSSSDFMCFCPSICHTAYSFCCSTALQWLTLAKWTCASSSPELPGFLHLARKANYVGCSTRHLLRSTPLL
jgi:hypothetical protein